ncbi:MAG TPA: major facilitator superfamily domain-containing protein 6 [Anaerolineales bacterium]|nr:major facilitator superfamily domain-containing protein 6 [Anaerolineales bacterium]
MNYVRSYAFYFLYYAGAAALIPFLTIHYKSLGFSGGQIGIFSAVIPLVSLFSGPLWGWLADSTRKHQQALILAMMGAIGFAILLAIPHSFYILLVMLILFAFFSTPIMPLVDNATLAALGDHKDHYGRIRLWGAVGWGIAAPVIGYLTESSGLRWAFGGYVLLMGLGVLVATQLSIRSAHIDALISQDMRAILQDPRWRIFLIVAFVGGILLSAISSFLFIYLQDIGAHKTLLGFTLTVATLSELPVLYFSSILLRRWGMFNLMIVALFFFAIRALAYSFISLPWMALPIQLLHGLTFSLMWAAGISYADRIAPPGMSATAQGLFSGVMLGVGSATGSLLGGFLFDVVGAIWMFRVVAGIAVLAIGILWSINKSFEKTI